MSNHMIDCPRCGHCCPGTAEQAQPVWDASAPLVVHPHPAFQTATQQRQPLTDAEVYAVWEKAAVQDNGHHARLDNQPFVHFARAIEAAHGIKGEA